MKKKILLFVFSCFVLQNISAQSKLMVGTFYSLGASSIYGDKMAMDGMSITPAPGAILSEYTMKMSGGTGLRCEYFFNEKISLTFQSGYSQRGAKFIADAAAYSPRYKFNYIDVVIGLQYQANLLMKKHKDFLNVGFSQHTLLNANRVNSYGAVNITSDLKKLDWGIFLGIGHSIPILEKDYLQLQLFANAGLTNVLTGTFEMNGIPGKNILYGLQVSYLLGKNLAQQTKIE